MRYELVKAPEYLKWLESQTSKDKLQIDARLDRLGVEGHFGTWRYLGDKVSELVKREYEIIVLVLGGNKSGQEKDIKKAKKIFYRETTSD